MVSHGPQISQTGHLQLVSTFENHILRLCKKWYVRGRSGIWACLTLQSWQKSLNFPTQVRKQQYFALLLVLIGFQQYTSDLFFFSQKKVVFYQTSPWFCIAFFQTRGLGCRTSPVNPVYLQKLLVRRENSPAALSVLEDPVALWDRYRPEMKTSILVSGKYLIGRQANQHLKMFLLNYTVCELGKNNIKENLHYLLPGSRRPLFWSVNIYHQMQSDYKENPLASADFEAGFFRDRTTLFSPEQPASLFSEGFP